MKHILLLFLLAASVAADQVQSDPLAQSVAQLRSAIGLWDVTTGQLRFTRYNVTDERFESRMEYTNDGGAIWTQGNHQVFRRASAASTSD